MQKDNKGNLRPVAFYSKKLTNAQLNYTTMEKELLSIVATLKEFRSMLLGAELHVHTDHKNLTLKNFNTQQVLRWRCYIEEFSPQLYYVPGPENVLADNMSRLNRLPDLSSPLQILDPEDEKLSEALDDTDLDNYYSILDDKELVDCLINLPPITDPMENPLNYSWMREKQQQDESLLRCIQRHPDRFIYKLLDDENQIICHVPPNKNPEKHWTIALSADMVKPTCEWFHQVLGHPGKKTPCSDAQRPILSPTTLIRL